MGTGTGSNTGTGGETGTGQTGTDGTSTGGTNEAVTERVFNPSPGGETGSLKGYITQAPICITYGDDYDASGLNAFITGRMAAVLTNDDDLQLLSVSTNTNAMNFTIHIAHDESRASIGNVLWDGTKGGDIREDTLCDDFENAYAGTTCENCMDVVTYALFDESGADRRRFVLAISLALALFVYV